MALFYISDKVLKPVNKTDFKQESILETQDLQPLIKNRIDALGEDLLIISEEYNKFEQSNRSIDLLALDKDSNLVVIELKRTQETGTHIELQAIRYAAMISTMTWDEAVMTFEDYLQKTANERKNDAEQYLLNFLEWSEPQKEDFALKVRIILIAPNFSKEITTSVLWLNQFELDITCIRLNLYKLDTQLILSLEPIIPLPETQDYQISARKKQREIQSLNLHERDRSTYSILFNKQVYKKRFKKADIGYYIVKLFDEKRLIDPSIFSFLREDKSCGCLLLKTIEEMTDKEKQYLKYRYKREPEIFYEDTGYYVARNWGATNTPKFIDMIEKRFPTIAIEKEDNG